MSTAKEELAKLVDSCSGIGSAFVAHESAHRDLPVKARNPSLEEATIVTRSLAILARK